VAYLYTMDYEDARAESESWNPMLHNIEIHTFADKYNIPALGALAAAKLYEQAEQKWNTLEFAELIYPIYANLDTAREQNLRDAVLAIAEKHSNALLTEKSGESFRAIAGEARGFGIELASKLALTLEKQRLESETQRANEVDLGCCESCKEMITVKCGEDCTIGYCPSCGTKRGDY